MFEIMFLSGCSWLSKEIIKMNQSEEKEKIKNSDERTKTSYENEKK